MPAITAMDIVFLGGGLVVGAVLVMAITKAMGRSALSNARREAAQIITDAEREVSALKKDAKTALKEQEIELRERLEQESQRQRDEIIELERRVIKKEEKLDDRTAAIDSKMEKLNQLERELAKRDEGLETERSRIKEVIAQQLKMLEQVSGMTADTARAVLFEKLENEVR